ncbi:hypothetical protein MUN76_15050 [Leucobacter rhizosphaerae]|uniref:Lipoprotein n=1 Tax=Leucobacter rhizosphaerae TaxID=2932245 RepID=A0ABY4FW28_9MICO|nr:hypothetical protein [Leucobacter rhizosphaerae]UOQ60329.1 hypothetical protein MUN76_15050 [Leucobacter rhizosphaerae]
MPVIRRSPALITLTALACLALPLAGCSALGIGSPSSSDAAEPNGAGDAGTTANGSCQAAAETIDRVIAEAQQNAPQLIEDLLAGKSIDPGALIEPVFTSLDAAGSGATDPAVIAAIDDARTEWVGLGEDIQGLGTPDLSGIDLGDLGTLGELGNLQTYGEDVSAIVSERLPALQQTGTALQEACTAAK